MASFMTPSLTIRFIKLYWTWFPAAAGWKAAMAPCMARIRPFSVA